MDWSPRFTVRTTLSTQTNNFDDLSMEEYLIFWCEPTANFTFQLHWIGPEWLPGSICHLVKLKVKAEVEMNLFSRGSASLW